MSELVQFLLATLASALSSRLRLLLTTSTSELSDPDLTLASLQRPAVAYPPLRHLADRHPAGDRSADYVVVGAAFLEARRPASPPAFANLLDATISLGFAHSTALAPWSDDAKLAALCGARPGHGNRPVEQTRIVFPSWARAAVPTDVMPLS